MTATRTRILLAVAAWRRPCWPAPVIRPSRCHGPPATQLQPRIDTATATRNCAALRAFLTAAKTTSTAHEKATGFPNDALVSYIQASQHEAGCRRHAGDPKASAMLEKISDVPDSVLGFRASGELTSDASRNLLVPAVEAALQSRDKLRLLYLPRR